MMLFHAYCKLAIFAQLRGRRRACPFPVPEIDGVEIS